MADVHIDLKVHSEVADLTPGGTECQRQKGVAKIKAEFKRQIRKPSAAEVAPTPEPGITSGEKHKTDVAIDEDSVGKGSLHDELKSKPEERPSKRQKKQRGQNKARAHQIFLDKSSLCLSIANGRSCDYGDKCKFSHDVKEYQSTRPVDLGEECINFKLKGECRYGLMCRFHKHHTDYETELFEQKTDEKKMKEYAEGTPLETNVLSKDLMLNLRKRRVDFTASDSFMKCLKSTEKARKKVDNSTMEKSIPLEANEKLYKDVISQSKCDVGVDLDTLLLQDGVSIMSRKGIFSYKDEEGIKLRFEEKKKVDFSDKLYLAPLTTVGNLPFRRIEKEFGADITCGEMAMCTNLLQGMQSEWALVNRHHTEDVFGIQVCGSFPDTMSRAAELLCKDSDVDFIDINCGCPIDLVFNKGCGCALMNRTHRLEGIVRSMSSVMDIPLTLKMRTGVKKTECTAHKLAPKFQDWGISALTIHGRSRDHRYTSLANWDYIYDVAKSCRPLPVFGNGDILSYDDYNRHITLMNEHIRDDSGEAKLSGAMIARGALVKPWVFTEIKERRNWDISSRERLDILRKYCNYGLEHYGSDTQGIEKTRRFLLEWLSFLHRYVPVGLLEVIPQRMNERPEPYYGRDDLETLMSSPDCRDWVKISEMLLGPVHENFKFIPKHKANAYS